MRHFKNLSLFAQVFAMFWFTILLITLITIAIPKLDPRNQKDVPDTVKAFLQKKADNIAALYSDRDMDADKFRRLNAKNMRTLNVRVFFTDLQGNLLYTSNKFKKGDSHKREQLKQVQNFISISDDFSAPLEKKYTRWRYAGPFQGTLDGNAIRVYFAHEDNDVPFFVRIFDNPIELLMFIMLISTPLLGLLTWRLTIPARKLQHAANRVASGNLEIDKGLETGSKEFKQTGESFNQMVSAINQMMTGQQRLLSDISHELRSPLTRLRMATSLATRKQGESKELSRIDLEAERLEQMISELLSLSRMQINSHQEIEETTANDLWLEILKDAQFEASQLNKELKWSGLGEYIIQGNIKLLMSAIENVIRNAVKYAQTHIDIEFCVQEQQLEIIVDDDGIGVPEGERELIFKPFYRVSTARDRTTGGTGLGLAITESTIMQHLGKVQALESPLGGLRIKIQLPLKKSHAE